jgi:hypothetical protein
VVNKEVKCVVIATPMYGGMCSGIFTRSLLMSMRDLGNAGYNPMFIDLYNESLITRARNMLTKTFLDSNGSHLVFIDADQSFRIQDIMRMVDSDLDIIGAPVPMKAINWDSVRNAANAGIQDLSNASAFFNINASDSGDLLGIDASKPLEVEYIGSGMLCIKREVFEKLDDSVDSYISDSFNHHNFGDTTKNYWFTSIDEDRRLLSEDFNFCRLWKSVGGKVYADLLAEVDHVGTHIFNGKLPIQKMKDNK